ncbi:unnamed protein product [Calypogeia fissa]
MAGGMKVRNGSPSRWNPARVRMKFQKNCWNLPLTLLCAVVTIMVLRGTFGFRSVMNPPEFRLEDDFEGEEAFEKEHMRNLAAMREKLKGAKQEKSTTEPESDPSTVPYSLGPKISNWNEQRAEWLEKNPHKKTPEGGQPKILLVTGSQPYPCENPIGDHYLLKSIKNKIDYCRLHDIDIFYNIAEIDEEMFGFWAKLPLIRKLMLAHPEVEWIWWMDSDAMFTDMVFKLPIQKYRDYSMVVHGYDDLIYENHNWVGLNTGSFLLRNNQWALDLLEIWAPMGPKGVRVEAGKMLTAKLEGRPTFEADDQSALIYLLVTREKELRKQVYLENDYYLHGYWMILVERFEEMMEKSHPGLGDETWPFVTHFVGCKPCKPSFANIGEAELARCMAQMERAFNFGDNQILEHYGLQHQALSTPMVKKIRNDSSTPLDFLNQTVWTPLI